MSEVSATERKPWIAAVLSAFCTGLGHVYSGKIVMGLTLFFASLLFAPMLMGVAFLDSSTPILFGIIGCVVAMVGLYLFAIIDAYRTVCKIRRDYQIKEYNRAPLYVLFIIVGVSYPLIMMATVRANFFEAFYIPTASMTPTLLAGDRILVNKVGQNVRFPERGELIVFIPSEDRNRRYVQRVIAHPGDTVSMKKNQMFVNGKKLEQDRVSTSQFPFSHDMKEGEVVSENNNGKRYQIWLQESAKGMPDFAEKKVPPGTCFVLGDHRNRSRDSRHFGFVPLGDIIGIVQYCYYPAKTWARFGVCEKN